MKKVLSIATAVIAFITLNTNFPIIEKKKNPTELDSLKKN